MDIRGEDMTGRIINILESSKINGKSHVGIRLTKNYPVNKNYRIKPITVAEPLA